ncbi:GNAT family N-acetyltransferase, partial [Jatrophihabitans sp. YIM 134969]
MVDIDVVTPDLSGLVEAAAALRTWPTDRGESQLHPGDLGWHWREGAERTAADVRVWTRGGEIVAVGLLDAPQLLRMAVDPTWQADHELVERLLADIDTPGRGVLDAGGAAVEARCGPLLRSGLLERGWVDDESWTPLHLDLTAPVADVGVAVEAVGPDGVDEWLQIHWDAFRSAPVTGAERRTAHTRWAAMAASPPFREARFLTLRDAAGVGVAAAGAWSAGRGRPGLLEPIGTAPGHRGHGYGRAAT